MRMRRRADIDKAISIASSHGRKAATVAVRQGERAVASLRARAKDAGVGTMHHLSRSITPDKDLLSCSIELEETEPPRSLTILVGMISTFILGFIVWAAVAPLTETASAPGVVLPSGDVAPIQHLDRGLVSELLVAEGQVVSTGQPLAKLAPLEVESERNQLSARRISLLLALEQNNALSEGREPNFESIVKGYKEEKQEQAAVYSARIDEAGSQLLVQQDIFDQKVAEAARLTTQETMLRSEFEYVSKEFATLSDLFERGLSTRDRYYSRQRDVQTTRKELENVRGQLTRALSERAEAENRIAEYRNTLVFEARQAAAEIALELREIEERLNESEARVGRLILKSPVGGVVKGLRGRSKGSVVQPGDTLMEIVPMSDRMVVRARISPVDIAHVHVGQEADVSIAAYDTSIYGSMSGEIELISASTFQTDEGESYYEATISLEKSHFGNDPARFPILPGMTVDAKIHTGSKTLLAYLLKPVNRGFANAFQER